MGDHASVEQLGGDHGVEQSRDEHVIAERGLGHPRSDLWPLPSIRVVLVFEPDYIKGRQLN